MENILVIGATGSIGHYIARELVQRNKNVTALVRTETLDDDAKTDPLKALGIVLTPGDLNDPESLKAACLGKDAVISAVTREGIGLQENLIEVLKDTDVKRFLPSEYGVDPYVSEPGTNDLFDAKRKIQESVKQANIPYTMLYTSGFMEYWCLGLGQLGHSSPPDEVEYYAGGDTPASMVSMIDIAKVVASSIDDPDAVNADVKITANAKTQEEIISLWERLNGMDVKRKPVSAEELDRRIESARIPQDMLQRILSQLHRSIWVYGDSVKSRPGVIEATERYRDIDFVSTEKYFRSLLG